MSRHRHVRNMNINDELEDSALSDGGEDEMTLEHQEQMEEGLEQVRNVIGDEQTSGLSDKTLRDALWEYFFDIGRTVQWALDEQARRRNAQERKGGFSDDASLSSLLQDDADRQGYRQYPHPWLQQPVIFDADRPRVPLIHLAQQQQQLIEEQHLREQQEQEEQALAQQEDLLQSFRRLSTIAEERTNQTSVNRSSTVTSYGTVIAGNDSSSEADTVKDSSRNPPGPINYRQTPPSVVSDTSSVPAPKPPQKSSETIPSLDAMPEIPDLNSKSSLLPQAPPDARPKKSKLSLLASSRASSIVSPSESSRSGGTTLTGSIKTYPGLRPTAQSLAPPSTIAPSYPEGAAPMSVSSSASSLVRRAIQAALELEAQDQNSKHVPTPTMSHLSTHFPLDKLSTSVPAQSPVRSQVAPPRGPSILQSYNAPDFHRPNSSPVTSPHAQPSQTPPTTVSKPKPKEQATVAAQSPPQPLSKLAIMAQAKVDPRKIPKLPKPTTEYLTPIANGPTVTTAITTHYQSLFSLTDPNQSSVLPKLDLVPLSEVSVSPSSPQKRSTKLAMKIRKGHEGRPNELLPIEPEEIPASVPPMFDPKATHSRASPSQFASLLVSDDQKDTKHSKHKARKNTTREGRSRDSRKSHITIPSFIAQATSAFDGPSPDDIIFNARHGTSLGQPRSHVSTSSRAPTLPSKS